MSQDKRHLNQKAPESGEPADLAVPAHLILTAPKMKKKFPLKKCLQRIKLSSLKKYWVSDLYLMKLEVKLEFGKISLHE